MRNEPEHLPWHQVHRSVARAVWLSMPALPIIIYVNGQAVSGDQLIWRTGIAGLIFIVLALDTVQWLRRRVQARESTNGGISIESGDNES